jgi:hypothetical protein
MSEKIGMKALPRKGARILEPAKKLGNVYTSYGGYNRFMR